MSNVIHLKGIKKSYWNTPVLKSLDLSVPAGTFCALVGKNGAGKSTLMRMIMRLETPDGGEGEILGTSIEADPDLFNQDIGYVSEAQNFPLKLQDHLSIYSKLYPRWDQKLFQEQVALFGIDLTKHYFDLSRGQKMQFSFSLATAIRPKLLLLDEITSVLDARARNHFIAQAKDFVKAGGTVLLATNIVSEVHHVADRMILIEDGAVAMNAPLPEVSSLFAKLKKPPGSTLALFENSGCVEVGLGEDDSITVLIRKSALPAGGVPAELIHPGKVTAEEAFIYFTHSKKAA